jgi:hypothetical protein
MRLSSSFVSFAALSCAALLACSDDNAGPGDTTGPGDTSDTTEPGDTTPDSLEDTSGPNDTTDTSDTNVDPDTTDTNVDPDTTDTTNPGDTDTSEPIPEPDVVVDMGNCSPQGGTLNVYDLQNPDCPDHPTPEPVGSSGMAVELTGLIITANYGDTWVAQDGRGGPYSGITIFNHGFMSDEAELGDVVDITGSYSEYFENTQVYLDTVEFVGTTAVPAPYVAAHPSHLATNGPLAEMFESVLVKVVDVATTHTQPDCPFDYGEFEVTGDLRIDDMGAKWKSVDACPRTCARLGDQFASITGPLLFTFGNHKLEPRTMDDFEVITKGAQQAVSKCTATECRAREDAVVTRQIVINEIMADPFGDDTFQEWIELYNPGNTTVNLGGWAIRDCGTQLISLFGPDAVVPARGYLVVGVTKDQDDNLGVDVDYEYGVNGFYLPNTVGSVLLYDGEAQNAVLIDQARYSRFETWTQIFQSGRSIERKSATSDGTKVESWQRGTQGFGDADNRGTPGARNTGAN